MPRARRWVERSAERPDGLIRRTEGLPMIGTGPTVADLEKLPGDRKPARPVSID